jgi:hypothetical protein
MNRMYLHTITGKSTWKQVARELRQPRDRNRENVMRMREKRCTD